MSRAMAEAEDWRCASEGGAAWRDAAPPLPSGGAPSRFFEAREIVRMLRDCGFSDATIAQVMGTARARLGTWEGSLARPAGIERLQDLAGIVRYFLKGAASPREVGRWLCRPNRHLGDRRPIEVLARRRW